MTHAKTSLAVSLAFLAALAAPDLRAQDTPPTTATAAASAPTGEDLSATIVDVVGAVQYRNADDQPWQKATVGLVLSPGAEFRTGLKSAVRFTLPGGQTITLDRLGSIKILTAIQEQGKITTDLGMKFGRTRWDIEKAGVEYSNTIRSPGATLAIRGTDVVLEDSAPFIPSALSTEGRAAFKNLRGQMIAFGGIRKAEVRADKQSPGETALDGSKIDPKTTFAGRDAAEQKIITEIPGLAGLDPGSQGSIIQIARDFGSSINTAIPTVPGPLAFLLQWQSITPVGVSDVDLSIHDPLGNTLSKNNPQVGSGSALGVFLNDSKGQAGANSQELAQWGAFFPQGQYAFTVQNTTGDAAQVTVQVSRGTRDIKLVGGDPLNPLILAPGESFTGTVDVLGGEVAPSEQGARSRPAKGGKNRGSRRK